ncbi:acyl-CoA dehydrogenase family protein [Chitiniphilus eburneus]|uniref:Acyl-CoA dehydrogenase/oxidase C-terminal domain-containing protein n=1 Tax=Chitiniphilus eburneus TaxID=2571148 RepID=A0A4U0PR41_9NEIS|nr:acyl-CoA dehydrogenase family protein [Chitiniphilus eburneus]TJZ70735.1 hypothetical protein FAZ21_14190 [Chitiniphilus eburneus]
MSAIQEAPEQVSALLDDFLQQVPPDLDGRVDSLETLRRLGLADDGAAPCWETLLPGEWFALLRGLGCRAPALASALLALRWATSCAAEAVSPDAPDAPEAECHLLLPAPPAQAPAWRFVAHGWIGQASTGALTGLAQMGGLYGVRVAAHRVTWLRPQTQAEARARFCDLLALNGGILWRLLDRTVEHVTERPLFGRCLIDFPAIQLRLSALQLRVLAAEEVAELLARQPSGALRAQWWRELNAIRIEAQQLCGGTGYMRESAFAQTLRWHEWGELLLRQCAHAEQGGPAGEVMHAALRERVRRRLAQSCGPDAGLATRWMPA